MSQLPVDKIINEAVAAEAWKCGTILVNVNPALAVRIALGDAGYTIVRSTEALIQRGADTAVSDERVFGLRAIPENLRKIANALAETVIVDAAGNPCDDNKAAARERIEIVIQAFVEETKKARS